MRCRGDEEYRGSEGRIDDAELILDLQSRTEEAMRPLLRRYTRLVSRVATSILRDPSEAEDVTQEVFLEVYRKAHLYDPSRGSVRVWLLQYAYHRSLRRKEALRRRAAYRAEALETVDGMTVRPRAAVSLLGLTRQESRWVLLAGLAQLPARQRLTLELACLEQLSLRDVAERLRVSLGSARHYYYRGLARLKTWARSQMRGEAR